MLQATAIAGMLSVLELGAGDYILQKISNNRFQFEKSIIWLGFALLMLAVLLANAALLFLFDSDFATYISGFFIVFSSALLVYYSIVIKLSYVISFFRKLIVAFSGFSILFLLFLFLINKYDWLDYSELLMVIYGYQCFFGVVCFSALLRTKMFVLEGFSYFGGIWKFALDGIFNPLAIGFLFFSITLMQHREDVVDYSVLMRLTGIAAMFIFIEIMKIWQGNKLFLANKVLKRCMVLAVVGVLSLWLTSEIWWKFLGASERGMSWQMALLLLLFVFSRVGQDIAGQFYKKINKENIAMLLSVISLVIILCVCLFLKQDADYGVWLIPAYSFIMFLLSFLFIYRSLIIKNEK